MPSHLTMVFTSLLKDCDLTNVLVDENLDVSVAIFAQWTQKSCAGKPSDQKVGQNAGVVCKVSNVLLQWRLALDVWISRPVMFLLRLSKDQLMKWFSFFLHLTH